MSKSYYYTQEVVGTRKTAECKIWRNGSVNLKTVRSMLPRITAKLFREFYKSNFFRRFKAESSLTCPRLLLRFASNTLDMVEL